MRRSGRPVRYQILERHRPFCAHGNYTILSVASKRRLCKYLDMTNDNSIYEDDLEEAGTKTDDGAEVVEELPKDVIHALNRTIAENENGDYVPEIERGDGEESEESKEE